MTTLAHGAAAVTAALVAEPVGAADVRTRAPAAPGIYAWWASSAVLSTLSGPPHPSIPRLRLLYVGLATKIRTRLASNHLGRTGSSTLRRTLAGFLLDEQKYRTRWSDRVVLVDDDENRLTEWMIKHLHVSWCEHPTPRDVEESIIRSLRPPLNVDHACGPALHLTSSRLPDSTTTPAPVPARPAEHPGRLRGRATDSSLGAGWRTTTGLPGASFRPDEWPGPRHARTR